MHGVPAEDVDLLHISHRCLPHSLDTAGGALSDSESVWLTPHAHSRSAPPGCSFHACQPERRRPRCCRLQLLNQAAQGSSSRWRCPKAVAPLCQLLLLLVKLKQAMAACLRCGPSSELFLHGTMGCMQRHLARDQTPLAQPHLRCGPDSPLILPMLGTRITQ